MRANDVSKANCPNEGTETEMVQSGKGICRDCGEAVEIVDYVIHHTGGED